MLQLLFLLFLAAPLIELTLLIRLGAALGAGPTIILCLVTAGLGLALVRAQGLAVLRRAEAALNEAQHAPGSSDASAALGHAAIHGMFLLVAGVMLMVPGFVSDTIGGLLLIPPVRLWLAQRGLGHVVVARFGVRRGQGEPSRPDGAAAERSPIDAAYRDVSAASDDLTRDPDPLPAQQNPSDSSKQE